MAERLAFSLDRGRHYRRAGKYILRKIIDSGGALGSEIRIIGKFTNQKLMTQVFRTGIMTENSHPSNKVVKKGIAHCITNSEMIGVIVKIHFGKRKRSIVHTIEEELTGLTPEDESLINNMDNNT